MHMNEICLDAVYTAWPKAVIKRDDTEALSYWGFG